MSQPILILLDYIEKILTDLNTGLRRKSLRKTRIAFEKLTELLDYLKELLPEEFVKENFDNFDRHVSFIKIFLDKKDFEWMKNNFTDIKKNDFPTIKKKIYNLPLEERIQRKSVTHSKNKIFIVHGRDHKPMKELKVMLQGFSLKPVVLHEQPSGSRTIVEKLEKYSDVGYAFVILTPDDVGSFSAEFHETMNNHLNLILRIGENLGSKAQKVREQLYSKFKRIDTVLKERARQNVVLEFGYFIGLLGRDRVCCLLKGEVERPSDIHGIVYIHFKESANEVKDKIVKELKEAGYNIKN